MNPHAIPPIIAALAYFIVGVFVFSRKTPNPVNRSFAAMLICVSLWNVEWVGLILGPNTEFVRIWGAIFRIPLLFIPPTFLNFSLNFSNPQEISRRNKIVLLMYYGFSCFFSLINWSPYFYGEIISSPWGYYFKGGPLYFLFVLQFSTAVLLSFFYMIRGYTRVDSYQRERLKYFFLATIVSFSLGSLNFLPQFGLQVYPLGSIAISIGLFIAAYSVVQHRLMDVSLFMAKGISYSFSLLVFCAPATLILIIIQKFFFQQVNVPFTILILLLGGGCAVFFGKIKETPLKNSIVRSVL